MNITANNKLKETIKRIDGAYAPATIRAYRKNFERFIEFCDGKGTNALPSNQVLVANFIKHLSDSQLKSASIRIAVASISAIHRLNQEQDPTTHPDVKIELRRMHRNLGRESKQAAGIDAELLNRMIKSTDNSLRGIRDRALLLTAYDSMCRRSELVSIKLSDVFIDLENRSVKIKLRRSKTDQDGLGKWLYLSNISQAALIDWVKASGIVNGMLFRGVARDEKITERLSASQINRIYKRIAKKSKVDASIIKHISGHSMRVGAAQDLLKSGASLPMMMQRGRWSKADTVMRYLENTTEIYTGNTKPQFEWARI
jgi:site-specific recombinase XerD